MSLGQPIYSYVVARSNDDVIGCENQLPWRLPSDLKRFKSLTLGKPIIMGRKTFESIGRLLPDRPNIIVTKDRSFEFSGALVAYDKASAMEIAEQQAESLGVNEIMVIGGEGIFNLFDDEVSTVFLTTVATDIPCGDAFFKLDFSDWDQEVKEPMQLRDGDEFPTEFVVYRRKSRSKSCGKHARQGLFEAA